MATIKSVPASEHQISNKTEDFFIKNDRLTRPMSPHLLIYKPQLTSMLSITHRGTGLAQSAILSGFAVAALLSPAPFPAMIVALQASHYGPATIFAAKFLVAFPFTFHLFNGCRHLVSR
jgi:succinate dehydrogenase (ubiquinone) cytochrome b560 subunit